MIRYYYDIRSIYEYSHKYQMLLYSYIQLPDLRSF